MQGLSIHCGGNRVEYQDVQAVQTPPPKGKHFPIPHARLVDEVRSHITAGNYKVRDEAHALSGKDGDRYFGIMTLEPSQNTALPGFSGNNHDGGLTIGIRNSHDQTFSAALVVGYRVFVCDNLSFCGDIRVARKHTRFIERDLRGLTSKAFGRLITAAVKQEQRIERYKGAELSDKDVHDLLIRSVDAKAIASTQLPRVLKEWRTPSHEEFSPRTAWSLTNAFTEVYKQDGKLDLTRKRSIQLTGMMDSYLGLAT